MLDREWRGGDDDPLTAEQEDRLLEWRDIALGVVNEMRLTAIRLAAEDLEAALAMAARARQALVDNDRRMAEAQRDAFRAGQPNELLATLKDLGEVDETLADIGEFIDDAKEKLTVLKQLDVPGSSKLLDLAEAAPGVFANFGKLNGLMEKFESIEPILQLAKATGTDIERIQVAFNAQVTIIGLLASVGGYEPLLAYWGPVVEKINTNLGVVIANLTRRNQEIIRSGLFKDPQAVNWSLFEGGYQMYVFLNQVMLMPSVNGPYPPMPAAVESYLRSKDDELLMARSAVTNGPTSETSLPATRDGLTARLFATRFDVWRFFYGSLPPPRR